MNTNTTERKVLNSQKKAIKLLNTYSLDVRAWEILVAVAQAPGEGLLDLLPKLEMSKSAFSRYVQLMSGEVIEAKSKRERIEAGEAWDLEKNPLLEVRPHPQDWRRKAVYLTRHGEKLLGLISEAFTE